MNFNQIQFYSMLSEWFKFCSHWMMRGICMRVGLYPFYFEAFLLCPFKEVNMPLPTFQSQGTQGFQTFMSSRWSCRSCPLQHQCDLCSISNSFVPWISIPFKIEECRTHHFMWRMNKSTKWAYVLWVLILTSRSHSSLVLGPTELGTLIWGCWVLWLRVKNTEL